MKMKRAANLLIKVDSGFYLVGVAKGANERRYENMFEVRELSIYEPEAQELIDELSISLQGITGNGGDGSFDFSDMENPRAVFLVAYEGRHAVGCGAIRELSLDIGEIKRVYARKKGKGIGRAIISALEERARGLGYRKAVLETRKINRNAVEFYVHNGYRVRENYGKYIGRVDAVCFEKRLSI